VRAGGAALITSASGLASVMPRSCSHVNRNTCPGIHPFPALQHSTPVRPSIPTASALRPTRVLWPGRARPVATSRPLSGLCSWAVRPVGRRWGAGSPRGTSPAFDLAV
jgi:hypothetical protein